MSTKLLYFIWTISIIFAIVADILLSVNDIQSSLILLNMSFWAGLIIWIILLCFQKNNRQIIHIYGIIGFIIVILVPMIFYSKLDPKTSPSLILPPL